MKVYKLSKGWAILIYITAPLLIALFAALLIMPFVSGSEQELKNLKFMAPLSLGMIVFMVAGIIDTAKGKFVIDGDKIFSVSLFSRRELMFNEIKGYRINDKYIFIEPVEPSKKKIKISTYYGNTHEIIGWLAGKYPDLDVEEAEQERDEILSNETYGFTSEQREERLTLARKVSKILNWTGGLIGCWALFFPVPYEYAVIACAIVPIICVIVLKYFNGLIKIDEKKGSGCPSIFWAIFVSCMGLCIRALMDYNIFDSSKIWMPIIVIAVVFTGFLIFANKEFTFKKASDYFTAFAILLFVFGYSYGAVVVFNCIYDKSVPEVYAAKVLGKRISSCKTRTYYLRLSSWGQQKEDDNVSVSKQLYTDVDENDEVTIYFMKGRFEIPWFQITR